jgi:hypothetical protein
MQFESGEIVNVYLHTPREKVIGILGELNAAGISIRGIDLEYYDDWISAISSGEQHLSMSDYFFPMWRVERVIRDAAEGDLPSMADRFEERTGRRLSEQ